MKKSKIILPALAMLLFSTAASVTGTVAWFAANQTVGTNTMTVQAKAENGIVIANAANGTFGAKTGAAHSALPTDCALYPTSTKTTKAWFHGNSDDMNSATASSIASITPVDADNGVGYVDTNTNTTGFDAADDCYYLLNSFYIKASAATAIADSNIYVNSVVATAPATPGSEALDKSLRVAIVLASDSTGANCQIFAPLRTAADTTNLTYSVGGTITSGTRSGASSVTATGTSGVSTALNKALSGSALSIPANNGTPIEVKVYIFFEGEDVDCKSANITAAALDTLSVSCSFSAKSL